MASWSARFRRAAAVLLGIHLTQATALAAVAPCDVAGGVQAVSAAPVVQSDHQTAAHHEHVGGHEIDAQPDTDTGSSSHHSDAPHTPSTCSMAMACAVAASPTVPVTLPGVTHRVGDVRVPRATIDLLTSTAHPPETPPPKS
jgi:hypothetical protein